MALLRVSNNAIISTQLRQLYLQRDRQLFPEVNFLDFKHE